MKLRRPKAEPGHQSQMKFETCGCVLHSLRAQRLEVSLGLPRRDCNALEVLSESCQDLALAARTAARSMEQLHVLSR